MMPHYSKGAHGLFVAKIGTMTLMPETTVSCDLPVARTVQY